MAKKKLNLNFISNKVIRKRTFNRRKEGLKKKLNDLKTLCNVDVCAVIYNPFNSTRDVWPSESGVNSVIERALIMKEKKCEVLNHEEFLNQFIEKVKIYENKLVEDNKETRLKEVMFRCLGGNMKDFKMNDKDRSDLCEFIDGYLKNLYHHKKVNLNQPNYEIGETSSMQMARTATTANMATDAVYVDMAPTDVSPFMAPPTMAEVSSSFLNAPFLNTPQPTNELQFIVSPNQTPGDMNSLSMTLLNHVADHVDFQISDNNQEVYIPSVDQDEIHYPNQTYDGNQQGFIEEMIKYAEETNFPWIVDNPNKF
ncbi:PREDICTED: agamous-like MADS-box protein AGL80 [Camelina sativa]|uniref:Agamous-like MADS-box protein AGL80 n=1 Tax=Camelina sativa TaxID=90675 RepID=A0ABM0SQ47_CAMSA|nr:PREDICTED: agamous-like MADS-box protein AGL80 [Camelina sativa]